MVKAIVFDIGGVLVDLDLNRCIRAFREILGFERITEILDASHQKGIYGDMEAGLLSADRFRELILYLLSNNNPISMARTYELFRRVGIHPETAFRGQFISCEMKLLKPTQECYREVQRRIGLPAGEILFIDDNQANVDAALQAGWQARYYEPGTSLQALLADL